MKSQNYFQMKTSEFSSLIHSSISSDSQIQCSENNQSSFVCVNKTCSKYPFLCQNSDCQCRKNHDHCLVMLTNSIRKSLAAKIISTQALENSINQSVESIIEKMSDFRDTLLSACTQRFQLCGFSQSQKKFLHALKQADGSLISGAKLWKIIQNIFQDQSIRSEMNKSIARIQKFTNKFAIKVKQYTDQVQAQVQQFERYVIKQNLLLQQSYKFDSNPIFAAINPIEPRDKLFLGSAIITDKDQIITMRDFFEKKTVKNAQILYRASENDFSVEKFHQKCDGIINTLVICQTEFNTKIGGFTSLRWSNDQKASFKADNSGDSFLFSLCEGDKFRLIKRQSAICSKKKFGPVFGGGGGNEYDLFISDKASSSRFSYAFVNEAYYNEKYVKGDKASLKKFTGNEKGGHFQIYEWEVWRLQIQNPLVE